MDTMNTVPQAGKNKSWVLWIILVVAVVAVVLLLSSSSNAPSVSTTNNAPADSAAKIANDLNSVQVNNLDQDFQSIDTDLNKL